MNLLDFLRDEESQRAMARGLLDAGNRGIVGGLLGAPVDATTGVVNAGLMAGGYLGNKLGLLSADQMPQPITEPVGGSEWFGNKMQQAGLVSPNRNALAEALASLAFPAASASKPINALAKVAFNAEQAMLANAAKPSTLSRQAGVLRFGEGSNLADAEKFAERIRDLGKQYAPRVEETSGGTVYVTVDKIPLNRNGEPMKNRKPDPTGFKARFADHPQYWGSTISSDPFTQNTVDDAVNLLRFHATGKLEDAPEVLRSARFDPGTRRGEIETQRLNRNVFLNEGGRKRWDPTETNPFSLLPIP